MLDKFNPIPRERDKISSDTFKMYDKTNTQRHNTVQSGTDN